MNILTIFNSIVRYIRYSFEKTVFRYSYKVTHSPHS